MPSLSPNAIPKASPKGNGRIFNGVVLVYFQIAFGG
jgi:hypothetical protein